MSFASRLRRKMFGQEHAVFGRMQFQDHEDGSYWKCNLTVEDRGTVDIVFFSDINGPGARQFEVIEKRVDALILDLRLLSERLLESEETDYSNSRKMTKAFGVDQISAHLDKGDGVRSSMKVYLSFQDEPNRHWAIDVDFDGDEIVDVVLEET